MSGATLRPYQVEIIDQFDTCVASGIRKIIMVATTGSGKTVIGSEIVRRAVADGRRVLFLAHRREIVMQTSAKLRDNGIEHGLIMAGEFTSPLEPVQVAAIQTLLARAVRRNKIALPSADILIADESHHAPAPTWKKIIEAYPDAIGEACRHCGFLPAPKPKRIEVIAGDLGLVTASGVEKRQYSRDELIEWVAGLKYLAEERAAQGRPYNGNWPYANFRAKFGNNPPIHTSQVVARPPTHEIRSWVKSRQIAFAKSRAAA